MTYLIRVGFTRVFYFGVQFFVTDEIIEFTNFVNYVKEILSQMFCYLRKL